MTNKKPLEDINDMLHDSKNKRKNKGNILISSTNFINIYFLIPSSTKFKQFLTIKSIPGHSKHFSNCQPQLSCLPLNSTPMQTK